jgi:hypothetical protein
MRFELFGCAALACCVVLTGFGVSAATQINAAPQPTRDERQFQAFFNADRHHRSSLDREERLDYQWSTYARYSSSGGESLSLKDFQDMRCLGSNGGELPEPQRTICTNDASRVFRRLTGSRGALVKQDIAGEANGFFRRNDLNHDGLVSWGEYTSGAAR